MWDLLLSLSRINNSIFFQRRIEFRRADREHLGAALRTRRGWQMQKCCDAPVCQPREALDQLFIRIEKIVTGRLDIVETRSLNGCENEMVVRVVRTVIGFLPFAGKPMNVESAQSRWN